MQFSQLLHLSTRQWLMRQLSAVHAKSMTFGATTQVLHSEPICETSTVETVATRPDSVAQNTFTANKTHVSDTTRSTTQGNARPARANTFRYASLVFRLDSSRRSEPTKVTHVGQKQFVHNWTAQASNTNQVFHPTREGLNHLFFRKQRATLGVDGPIGIAIVVPVLVLPRRGLSNRPELIHGKPGSHPSYFVVHGRKVVELQSASLHQ